MGKVFCKFSVECKCHNHDAFREFPDFDRICKILSHD